MSRRARIDAVIVGGGVVGSAAALALAQRGLQVALVEAEPPRRWSPDARDLRVYALAPDNAALLDSMSVWAGVRAARAQAYRRMRVWDCAGGGQLLFDADALGRIELGWIVEHGLLADRLWQALPGAGVQIHAPARLAGFHQDDEGVRVELDDGSRIDARLAIAADGAESTLRTMLDVALDAHDYAQRGVVCFVASEQPHAGTALQRFLPGGPLALLPFADGDCSIVWTLPDADAERMLTLDDDDFADAVSRASDHCLGRLRPTSKRVAFPLRRQLAKEYVRGRVLLLGDAAHVVHPLAGQGVNLGLRDAAALAETMDAALALRADIAAPRRLARWARERRSENAAAAHAFEAINRVFSDDGVLATLLRGHALGVANRVSPLSHALWRRASGS